MTLLEEIDVESPPASDPESPRWRPWIVAAALVLCSLLIFAHFGCHGDEDNELFSLGSTPSVSRGLELRF